MCSPSAISVPLHFCAIKIRDSPPVTSLWNTFWRDTTYGYRWGGVSVPPTIRAVGSTNCSSASSSPCV